MVIPYYGNESSIAISPQDGPAQLSTSNYENVDLSDQNSSVAIGSEYSTPNASMTEHYPQLPASPFDAPMTRLV